MKNFQLSLEQATALYIWLRWQYLPYEDEILHNMIKQLREYVDKNNEQLVERDSTTT